MYVCMYVMYVRNVMNVMYEMNAMDECMKDVQKHGVCPDFWQKDVGSPSQQKSRQGESSLGPLFCDTGSPKTTFSGTSSNCRAVRGGRREE